MSTLPGRARAVVIGAGIVGNSLVYHLARLGWKNITQIEKGPLPNPGGSTGHASNFIFLTDHSREMTALTADSVEQYKEMGVFTQSGGIEVARTPERMEELKRVYDPQAFMPHYYYGGMPQDEAVRNMRMFAAMVMPEIKSWTATSSLDDAFMKDAA